MSTHIQQLFLTINMVSLQKIKVKEEKTTKAYLYMRNKILRRKKQIFRQVYLK
jgi:hypothetical protein